MRTSRILPVVTVVGLLIWALTASDDKIADRLPPKLYLMWLGEPPPPEPQSTEELIRGVSEALQRLDDDPSAELTQAEETALSLGSAEGVAALMPSRGHVPAFVEALIARARSQRRLRDHAAFRATLELLHRNDHALADEYLIALMREREFHIGSNGVASEASTAQWFAEALEGSFAPGIADAALARLRASEEPSKQRGSEGWARLVLEHGTGAQISDLGKLRRAGR